MTQPLLILIPARNESAVIGATVSAAIPYLLSGDRLVVIDDGSTDATAAVAERAGAAVLRHPPTGSAGNKGDALRWGLAQLRSRNADSEVVIILDADTRIAPQFLDAIRAQFDQGAHAVQGFIVPVASAQSPIAALAACSTLMEQAVDDCLRARLGWPVRLRGTGMAFHRRGLDALLPRLKTSVEDVELSLLLAERGVKVVFAPEAIIYDPLPSSAGAASRQRARWLAGQAGVWRHYWPTLIGLSLQGPGAWSLIGSLLLKPRAIFIILRLVLLLGSLLWHLWWPLPAILGASLLADALYIGIAIALFGGARKWQVPLVAIPLYATMWLRGLIMAVRGPRSWLRTRPQ